MKVSKKDAVRLFSNLGFDWAENASSGRLEKRLRSLDTSVDSDTSTGDEATDELMANVISAIREGEEIELCEEEVEEEVEAESEESSEESEEEKPKAKKVPKKPAKSVEANEESEEEKPKAKKVPKKPAKEGAEKKEGTPRKEIERDAFGVRVGSGSASINSTLTKKWQGIEEIVSASGQTPVRVKDHVRWMLKNGYVEKSDEGQYRLTGNTKS